MLGAGGAGAAPSPQASLFLACSASARHPSGRAGGGALLVALGTGGASWQLAVAHGAHSRQIRSGALAAADLRAPGWVGGGEGRSAAGR